MQELKDAIMFSPSSPPDLNLEHEAVLHNMAMVINIVSSEIESYIGRPLGFDTYIEKREVSGNPQMVLSNLPLKRLISIGVIGGGKLNINNILRYTDSQDMRRGILYLGHAFPSASTVRGFGLHRQYPLKSIIAEYEAGYILPKDETDTIKSDLPYDIRGIALSLALKLFENKLNDELANGLIQRQEGNVNRVWQGTTSRDVLKYGSLDITQQRILDRYKTDEDIFSV